MDIGASNWNEADASNSTAAPDGWPEGMAPSGVNDAGRAMMGAVKRWYDQSIPLVTGGTSTAYTLSYSVAPGALVDGMTHLVQFNAVNGAAPTLNVGALGAKPIHFYGVGAWGACPANMFAVDQVVRVTYNATAGAYRAMFTPMVLRQSVSGVSVVDFTGIPSNVQDLEVRFDLLLGTNNTNLGLQFYGSGGSLDSTSVYAYSSSTFAGTGTAVVSPGVTTAFGILGSISNSANFGASGTVSILNIQGTKWTQCNWQASCLDQGSISTNGTLGLGVREVAGPITGLRLFASAGIFSGKIAVTAK